MSMCHTEDSCEELDPVIVDMLKRRYACPYFRILIIGRANAGKTTLLEKMCGVAHGTRPIIYDQDGIDITHGWQPKPATGWRRLLGRNEGLIRPLARLKPSIFRGMHDIGHQITYPGSNFIFHDSQGFEAGGVDQMKRVRSFIQKMSTAKELKDQLHAIWYCIPMDSPRPLPKAELEFFNQGAGKVPLVAVFTKFDGQIIQEYGKLLDMQDEGAKWDMAKNNAEKNFQELYLPLVWNSKHPPRTYVRLQDMDLPESNCSQLTEKTAEAIDIASLQQLFTSLQMNNLNLCIRSALRQIVKGQNSSWSYIPYEIFSHFPFFWKLSQSSFLKSGLIETNFECFEFADNRDLLHQFIPLFGIEDIEKVFSATPEECQALIALVIIAKRSFWMKDINISVMDAFDKFKKQGHIEMLKNNITSETLHSNQGKLVNFLYEQAIEI